MLAQLDQDLPFAVVYLAGVTGKTGLAPTVNVYGPSGARLITGALATEWGDGVYVYTLPWLHVTQRGFYVAVFHSSDITVLQQDQYSARLVGVAGVDYLDASIAGLAASFLSADPSGYGPDSVGYALAKISTPGIVPAVISPVRIDHIELVQGNDHVASIGRSIVLTEPAPSAWPDLSTLQSVVMTARPRDRYASSPIVSSGVALAPLNGFQRLQFELASEVTLSLRVGPHSYNFDVVGTWAGDIEVTLALGTWTVLPRYKQ